MDTKLNIINSTIRLCTILSFFNWGISWNIFYKECRVKIYITQCACTDRQFSCWFLTFLQTFFVDKLFSKVTNYLLNSCPFSTQYFTWMWLSADTYLVQQLDCYVRGFFFVLSISRSYLVDIEAWDLKYSEPNNCWLKDNNTGKAWIIQWYISTFMMLNYQIDIQDHQLHTCQILWFYIYNYIGWDIPIATLTIFELLKLLSQIYR